MRVTLRTLDGQEITRSFPPEAEPAHEPLVIVPAQWLPEPDAEGRYIVHFEVPMRGPPREHVVFMELKHGAY